MPTTIIDCEVQFTGGGVRIVQGPPIEIVRQKPEPEDTEPDDESTE